MSYQVLTFWRRDKFTPFLSKLIQITLSAEYTLFKNMYAVRDGTIKQ